MRELLRAYQNAVAGEVARFEGHVAKFMGDGVLAYFGWPQAHEDDAERAVRAGLAVVGGRRRAARRRRASRWPPGSGSRPGSSSSATCSARARRGRRRWSARPRTSPPGCRPSAEPGDGGDRRRHPPAGRRAVRARRRSGRGRSRASPRRSRPSASSARAGRRAASRRGTAARPDAAGRARAGAGAPARPLAAGPDRRGPGGAALGRARDRQVAAGPRPCARRPAAEGRTSLRYQCSPHHTDSALWPVDPAARAGRRPRARGRARGSARQAGGAARRAVAEPAARQPRSWRRSSACDGSATATRPRDLTPQQRKARTFQVLVDQLAGLARRAAGPGGARGRALGRPDHAGAVRPDRRPAPAPAGAARRDLPPRAAAALDGLPARHAAHPRPPRPAARPRR